VREVSSLARFQDREKIIPKKKYEKDNFDKKLNNLGDAGNRTLDPFQSLNM
jgi:hypothetical protein